jgi:hypothetical protein
MNAMQWCAIRLECTAIYSTHGAPPERHDIPSLEPKVRSSMVMFPRRRRVYSRLSGYRLAFTTEMHRAQLAHHMIIQTHARPKNAQKSKPQCQGAVTRLVPDTGKSSIRSISFFTPSRPSRVDVLDGLFLTSFCILRHAQWSSLAPRMWISRNTKESGLAGEKKSR